MPRCVRLSAAAAVVRKTAGGLRKLIERHARGGRTANFYGLECRTLRKRWHVDLGEWGTRRWLTVAEAAEIVGRSEAALRRAAERFVRKLELDPGDGFDLDGMYWRRFGPRCWLVDVGCTVSTGGAS